MDWLKSKYCKARGISEATLSQTVRNAILEAKTDHENS